MKTGRLLRLAELLDQYQDRDGAPEFDLMGWGEFDYRRAGFLGLRKVSCNTAACAVGLACVSSEFVNDGLEYRVRFGQMEPVYGDDHGWYAVDSFFGLAHEQSRALFHHGSYDGATCGADAARSVAARIRELVKANLPAGQSPTTNKRKATVAAIKQAAGVDA